MTRWLAVKLKDRTEILDLLEIREISMGTCNGDSVVSYHYYHDYNKVYNEIFDTDDEARDRYSEVNKYLKELNPVVFDKE